MTTTRTLTINIRLGDSYKTTSTLHRHLKRNNPTETYLFDLLPKYILTKIDFLVSRLERCEKIKALITKLNPLCNPIILGIPQELLGAYHNFSFYGSW